MNVKEAIEQLSKLPQDAKLVASSLAHGGSVPVQEFELITDSNSFPNWVEVVYCDDDERERYGLTPKPAEGTQP